MSDEKKKPHDPTRGFSPPKSEGVQFVRREEKGHYIWIREFLVFTAIPVVLALVLGIWWIFLRGTSSSPKTVIEEPTEEQSEPKIIAPAAAPIVPPRESHEREVETAAEEPQMIQDTVVEAPVVVEEVLPLPTDEPTNPKEPAVISGEPVDFEVIGEGLPSVVVEEAHRLLAEFWTSPTPDTMSKFVMNGQIHLPTMQRHYDSSGLLLRRPASGQKVVLRRSEIDGYYGGEILWDDELTGMAFLHGGDDGQEMKLDWPSLVGACDPPWNVLVEGGGGTTQVLARAFIAVDSIYGGGFSSADYICFRMAHPYREKVIFGYVRRSTSLQKELKELIKLKADQSQVTLRLLKLQNTASRSYLIEGIASDSWFVP